jgi:hypothetical protein
MIPLQYVKWVIGAAEEKISKVDLNTFHFTIGWIACYERGIELLGSPLFFSPLSLRILNSESKSCEVLF